MLLFAFIFLLSYRERSIIRILTRFINPLFIALLVFVIIVGYVQTPLSLIPIPAPVGTIFKTTFSLGYQTLDLLAMLFLYSFMFSLLKEQMHAENEFKKRSLSYTGLKAGVIGLGVLTLVYIGLIHLGSNYSPLSSISHGKLFDAVSYQLFGTYGSIITGLIAFLACISTAMALAAIVAEWLQHIIFNNAIDYKGSLLIVLLLSIPFSTSVLDTILKITSGPLITIGYPVLATITVCNILYKTVGFKPIKLPTAIAFVVATAVYLITNKLF
jgi:LIVCS family branched-chain amino acid:cation transporter